MTTTATLNHALQRTAPCVTVAAPPQTRRAATSPHSAVAELGVIGPEEGNE